MSATRHRYSPELKAKVVRHMRDSGCSYREAAEKFDVPNNRVYEWVAQADIPQLAPRSLTSKRLEAERLFVQEGKTAEEIASLLVANIQTVGRWLRRYIKENPAVLRDLVHEVASLRADNARLRTENAELRTKLGTIPRLRKNIGIT